MVAGHLQEKKGCFYMVLSYPHAAGKKRNKMSEDRIACKGNKKRGEDVNGNKADLCA